MADENGLNSVFILKYMAPLQVYPKLGEFCPKTPQIYCFSLVIPGVVSKIKNLCPQTTSLHTLFLSVTTQRSSMCTYKLQKRKSAFIIVKMRGAESSKTCGFQSINHSLIHYNINY